MFFAVFFIKCFSSGFNGEFAHSGNGIPGVDTQIGQDLVDLGRVHFHRPQMGSRLPDQVDVFSDEPAQHIEHTFHGIVQIQLFGGDGLFSGKGQQLLCDISRALRCGLNFFQIKYRS